MIQKLALFFFFVLPLFSKGQDTAKLWFADGDDGFYGYLADRLQGLGHDKPGINRNGENVIFEFRVTDSGWVDSVHILQCMEINLCVQLRYILNSMPRVNAAVANGKTVSHLRMYNVIVKNYADGYRVEPNTAVPDTNNGRTSSAFKLSVVLVAVVALFILVFK